MTSPPPGVRVEVTRTGRFRYRLALTGDPHNHARPVTVTANTWLARRRAAAILNRALLRYRPPDWVVRPEGTDIGEVRHVAPRNLTGPAVPPGPPGWAERLAGEPLRPRGEYLPDPRNPPLGPHLSPGTVWAAARLIPGGDGDSTRG